MFSHVIDRLRPSRSRPQPQTYGVHWAPGTRPTHRSTAREGLSAYSDSSFQDQDTPSTTRYSQHQQPRVYQRTALRTDGQYATTPTPAMPPPPPRRTAYASDDSAPTPFAPRMDTMPLPEVPTGSPTAPGMQYQPLAEEPAASPEMATNLRRPPHLQRSMPTQAQAPAPASYNNQGRQVQPPSPPAHASLPPYAPRRAGPHNTSARQAEHVLPPAPPPAPYVTAQSTPTAPQTHQVPQPTAAGHAMSAERPAMDPEATDLAARCHPSLADSAGNKAGHIFIDHAATFRRADGVYFYQRPAQHSASRVQLALCIFCMHHGGLWAKPTRLDDHRSTHAPETFHRQD